MITLDYAMKMLPMLHRMKQEDHFAQRGYSWHVTNIVTKQDDHLYHHNIMHIIKQDRQDNASAISILRHVATILKEKGIENIYVRSDNAGKILLHKTKKFSRNIS
jgi:hypothetical protein